MWAGTCFCRPDFLYLIERLDVKVIACTRVGLLTYFYNIIYVLYFLRILTIHYLFGLIWHQLQVSFLLRGQVLNIISTIGHVSSHFFIFASTSCLIGVDTSKIFFNLDEADIRYCLIHETLVMGLCFFNYYFCLENFGSTLVLFRYIILDIL